MARLADIDFKAFVERQAVEQQRRAPTESAHAYAYPADRALRRAFERARAVELAVASAVRVFQQVERARLLGRAVQVGPRQFPRVAALTQRCAARLGIPVPTTYVVSSPTLNAATFGTRENSFILVHSALIDHLTDAELLSVLGHECGHIHNDHVVYLTALHMLTRAAGAVTRTVSLPATLGLRAWSRRAEVTCDRAGALCSGDLDASLRALTKLALGSQRLYAELNVEEFLAQTEQLQRSVGRYLELLELHPFLPKRVRALRAFGQSELFRRRAGLGEGGRSLEDVDDEVHGYIKVLG